MAPEDRTAASCMTQTHADIYQSWCHPG